MFNKLVSLIQFTYRQKEKERKMLCKFCPASSARHDKKEKKFCSASFRIACGTRKQIA